MEPSQGCQETFFRADLGFRRPGSLTSSTVAFNRRQESKAAEKVSSCRRHYLLKRRPAKILHHAPFCRRRHGNFLENLDQSRTCCESPAETWNKESFFGHRAAFSQQTVAIPSLFQNCSIDSTLPVWWFGLLFRDICVTAGSRQSMVLSTRTTVFPHSACQSESRDLQTRPSSPSRLTRTACRGKIAGRKDRRKRQPGCRLQTNSQGTTGSDGDSPPSSPSLGARPRNGR